MWSLEEMFQFLSGIHRAPPPFRDVCSHTLCVCANRGGAERKHYNVKWAAGHKPGCCDDGSLPEDEAKKKSLHCYCFSPSTPLPTTSSWKLPPLVCSVHGLLGQLSPFPTSGFAPRMRKEWRRGFIWAQPRFERVRLVYSNLKMCSREKKESNGNVEQIC